METEELTWVEVTAPKLEQEPTPTPTPTPSPAPAERIELVLGSGLVVRVPAHFESEALRRLLAVVG